MWVIEEVGELPSVCLQQGAMFRYTSISNVYSTTALGLGGQHLSTPPHRP